MNKRKIIIIAGVVLLVLILALCLAFSKGLFNSEKEQNEGNNNIVNNNVQNEVVEKITNVKLEGTKTLNALELSDIEANLSERNKSVFTANVKNTSNEYVEAINLRIKIVDDSGMVDEIFGGGIRKLAPYEEVTLKTIVLSNIMDMKDVEFEVIQ